MSRIYISAAHKSSGKTTLSIGLCAAMRRLNLDIRPFKKGPDYIDPMWLGRASAHPCHNLDFNTMSHDEILSCILRYGAGGDLNLIEGNKGLYDGMALTGEDSNAAMAMLLDTPVILVLNTQGITRGVAPLLLGYELFADEGLHIAGVIFNQVGGTRHERKLRTVTEHYTNIPVLGAVHRHPSLSIEERHLGLMPSNEKQQADTIIEGIAERVEGQVDLAVVLDIAAKAKPLAHHSAVNSSAVFRHGEKVRIAIMQDAAFGFYYPGDLDALHEAGAELIPVNALQDRALPAIDGLFIGGGFPETQMQALESNRDLREAIFNAIEQDLPVYAECGGLMYLARRLCWQGQCCQMVGCIPSDVVMHKRPRGRGYVRVVETENMPWAGGSTAQEIRAHEFHYSALENLDKDHQGRFAYRVLRGFGIDGEHDGWVYRNVLASYVHMRDTAQYRWAQRFVDFVRQVKLTK